MLLLCCCFHRCIAMHPQQLKQAACSSGTSTCQVALGLCWAPLAAPSATSSSSPADRQAPGCATTAADADAAGSGAAVHCRGRVSLHLESSKTAITHADFDMVFQRSGQFQGMPTHDLFPANHAGCCSITTCLHQCTIRSCSSNITSCCALTYSLLPYCLQNFLLFSS